MANTKSYQEVVNANITATIKELLAVVRPENAEITDKDCRWVQRLKEHADIIWTPLICGNDCNFSNSKAEITAIIRDGYSGFYELSDEAKRDVAKSIRAKSELVCRYIDRMADIAEGICIALGANPFDFIQMIKKQAENYWENKSESEKYAANRDFVYSILYPYSQI